MAESSIAFLRERFADHAAAPAIVWRDQERSYGEFLRLIDEWGDRLAEHGIGPGAVTALVGDYSPNTIALLLALVDRAAVVVPFLATTSPAIAARQAALACVEHTLRVDLTTDEVTWAIGRAADVPPLVRTLRDRGAPGLILFTSGSSGEPKGVVHDVGRLFQKFHRPRPALKILNFLLFDHLGGLNTLFHTLSNAGTVYAVPDRNPDTVCETIARHRIQVLPASPTFLNLMLLSGAQRRHDLSSLEVISYGTEPMPPSTLARLADAFPGVKLQQTYGMIELGALRSQSRSRDSLWVRLGGEGFATRVVDGQLQIKAVSAMLGYLNAPSPFTDDGWFMTGDAVEVDGEYFRILGRQSEVINVGGEKVYPQEVENVIQGVANVAEVAVHGEKNLLVGNIVCATVRLVAHEDPAVAIARIRQTCAARLARFKMPVKVSIVDTPLHGERMKKVRPSLP